MLVIPVVFFFKIHDPEHNIILLENFYESIKIRFF